MPSLFRRKPADPAEETHSQVSTDEAAPAARPRSYTPSKRELGRTTPKRPAAQRKPPAAAKPLTKQEARELRRQRRAEAAAEFRREGGPRDRGPEKALARDVVDSRRTIGTWFFVGALVFLFGSQPTMPRAVQLASNALWVLLALGVIVDSVLICRKIKKLVHERFPKTEQRMRSLYLYATMRGMTFRRMRAPAPRVKIGDPV